MPELHEKINLLEQHLARNQCEEYVPPLQEVFQQARANAAPTYADFLALNFQAAAIISGFLDGQAHTHPAFLLPLSAPFKAFCDSGVIMNASKARKVADQLLESLETMRIRILYNRDGGLTFERFVHPSLLNVDTPGGLLVLPLTGGMAHAGLFNNPLLYLAHDFVHLNGMKEAILAPASSFKERIGQKVARTLYTTLNHSLTNVLARTDLTVEDRRVMLYGGFMLFHEALTTFGEFGVVSGGFRSFRPQWAISGIADKIMAGLLTIETGEFAEEYLQTYSVWSQLSLPFTTKTLEKAEVFRQEFQYVGGFLPSDLKEVCASFVQSLSDPTRATFVDHRIRMTDPADQWTQVGHSLGVVENVMFPKSSLNTSAEYYAQLAAEGKSEIDTRFIHKGAVGEILWRDYQSGLDWVYGAQSPFAGNPTPTIAEIKTELKAFLHQFEALWLKLRK